MSSQTTRYLLVAKVIIGWVQTNVFKEDAFAGLDKGIDDAILETRKKIFNNTPAPVRFVFLQDIADQFKRLQKCPKYEEFRNSITHRRAAELWTTIRPLMYTKAEGDWEKMYNLMTEAHRVAEMQLSDIAEYRLFFPKMHDAFHDPSMVRMDSEFDHLSAEELVAQRITVKFSATPQVMARITSPDGNIMTKTLMRAGVLLKA